MPSELQTRLLRVLADGEYYPIGARVAVKSDVRIIAATHQNLEVLVSEGRFREDLFHRLNVIRVHLPPLRERSQDVGLLMRHFLRLAATELESEIKTLKPEAEAFLSNLDWPGNVRQLENICRWLTVMSSGREIYIDDLPPELSNTHTDKPLHQNANWETLLRQKIDQKIQSGKTEIAKEIIPLVEKILIQAGLDYTSGKRQEAAVLLGYGRNTLTRKIKELDLE